MRKKKSDKGEDAGSRGKRLFPSWKWMVPTALLAVFAVILLVLPFALELGAERFLSSHGARSARIMNVDFNPFLGRVAVFGLEIAGPEEGGLEVERFETRIDLWSLVKKRIRVVRTEISGLRADIWQKEDGRLLVAGFPAGPGGEPGRGEESREERKPWGFGIGTVALAGIRLDLVMPGFDDVIHLRQLQMERFATWSPDEPGNFDLQVLLGEASFEASGAAKPFANRKTLEIKFSLADFPLAALQPFLPSTILASLSGVLAGEGQASFLADPGPGQGASEGGISRSAEGKLSLTLEDGAFGLSPGENPMEAVEKKLFASVEGSYSDTGTFSPQGLRARVDLGMDGFSLSGGAEGSLPLFGIGKAAVENLRIEGPNDVTIQSVNIEKISALARHPDMVRKGEASSVAALESLTVKDISLQETRSLHIGDISLDSLTAWILRKEGGTLEAAALLPPVKGEKSPAVEEEEAAPQERKSGLEEITLDRLTLAGDNIFTFRDLDAKPPVTMKVDSLDVEVTDFRSAPPEGKATLSMKAGMGKYTSLGIKGKILAPWDKPDLEAGVALKSLDLPQMTPYTDRYLGYLLKSGRLDFNMDVKITAGILDAETDLMVHRIEMSPVKEEDRQRAEERLGIPVRTALSLLKDKDDNIELTLPVEGDLSDPEFNISDVLVTVTGNALKKGISAYYKSLGVTLLTGGLIPPGTFTVLGQVFKGTATASFDPVVFDPLNTGLSGKGREFLTEMASTLSGKPDTRLVITGKVTREDIMALRQQATAAYAGTPAEEKPANLEVEGTPMASPALESTAESPRPPQAPPSVEEVPLSDEEKERLIGIAKQRAENVRDFLVETGGLNPDRLFVLYSEVEKEPGGLPPRVDLSI